MRIFKKLILRMLSQINEQFNSRKEDLLRNSKRKNMRRLLEMGEIEKREQQITKKK